MSIIKYQIDKVSGQCFTKCPHGLRPHVGSIGCKQCKRMIKYHRDSNIIECCDGTEDKMQLYIWIQVKNKEDKARVDKMLEDQGFMVAEYEHYDNISLVYNYNRGAYRCKEIIQHHLNVLNLSHWATEIIHPTALIQHNIIKRDHFTIEVLDKSFRQEAFELLTIKRYKCLLRESHDIIIYKYPTDTMTTEEAIKEVIQELQQNFIIARVKEDPNKVEKVGNTIDYKTVTIVVIIILFIIGCIIANNHTQRPSFKPPAHRTFKDTIQVHSP